MSGLIVDLNVGHVPPKKYIELALAKFPHYIGSMVFIGANAGSEAELVFSGDDVLPGTLDEFLHDLEENKDDKTILFFAHAGLKKTAISTESEQPFVILRDEEGHPLLLGMMEGEYFSGKDADPAHTDEYHVMNGLLIPKLKKLVIKVCGSDIEKLDEELDDEETTNSINALAGTRGIVVLQSITGKTKWYTKGNEDLEGEFPWGRVSNKLGFVEKSATEEIAKPTVTGRKTLFNRAKTVLHIADTKTVSEGKTIAEQIDNPPADTAVEPKRPLIRPPESVMKKGKNAVGGWYKEWGHGCADALPTNYKDGVEVEANDRYLAQNVSKYGKLKEKLEEFKKRAEESGAVLKTGNPPITGVIAPNLKRMINELLDSGAIKAITEKAQVLDPSKLGTPPDVAPFSAQIGRDFTETFRWDGVVLDKFIRKCSAENDFTPVRQLIVEYQQEMFKLLAKPADEKEDEVEEAEVVVEPAKTSVPTIKKPGGLLGKRRVAA